MRKFCTFLFLGGALALVACSAKVESSKNPIQLPGIGEKATIPGPNIEGRWESQCSAAPAGGYRVLDVSINGDNVTRSDFRYKDSVCGQFVSYTAKNGTYRFVDKYSDGGYEVEYAFYAGQGATEYTEEKILLSNSVLYISDYMIGEKAKVLVNEPLHQVATFGQQE
jgi:hypothetical protein